MRSERVEESQRARERKGYMAKVKNVEKLARKTEQTTNHQEKELKHEITRQLFQLKCIITTFVDCCFTVKSLVRQLLCQRHDFGAAFHSVSLCAIFRFVLLVLALLLLLCVRYARYTMHDVRMYVRADVYNLQLVLILWVEFSVRLETLIIKLCIEEWNGRH